jgi:hypothetical protein
MELIHIANATCIKRTKTNRLNMSVKSKKHSRFLKNGTMRNGTARSTEPASGMEAPGKALVIARIVARQAAGVGTGGASRDRTDDLLLAKQALSQLSYGPSP